MDLKKRLASLDRMTRRKSPTGEERARVSPEILAVEKLGLIREETPSGICFIRDYLDHIPPQDDGPPDLTGFFTQPGTENVSVEDVLFLDTETTGLAGGTGTIPFVVGVSWWEKSSFRTRQYFLCGPGQEPAMLKELHLLASRFKTVASFNGASFDLPLLRTRALLNRLEHPWDSLTSWDLLVPSRRLWGRRLDNCRQQSVEAGVCHLKRDQRDIAGSLIPQTWFDFLQLGRWEDLKRVLYHNQRDMVGMAHIFNEVVSLAGVLRNPDKVGKMDWYLAWALGRIAENALEVELSLNWFEQARQTAEDVPDAFADKRFVADAVRVLKRGGNWAVVENVIACALENGQNEGWLHREAAILYEHRLVDLARALHHARKAGEEHRLRRLLRKLETLECKPGPEDLN